MGYDIYFINHTKKEYISHKKTTNDLIFEEGNYLLTFLYLWNNCNIEILEENIADELEYLNEYKSLDYLKWNSELINSTDALMEYYQNNL